MKAFVIIFITSLVCFGADMGRLKTAINPGRAGIFIDGNYVGPAANFGVPRTYDVAAGEHEIKLVEPRYQDLTKKVTIEAGKTAVMKEHMTKLEEPKAPFGKIHFENADHFAAVYVNDKYMGHVDEFGNFAQSLKLAPGTYEMKIAPRNGAPIVKTVTVEANKTVTVQ
jgi:hypothetical protein